MDRNPQGKQDCAEKIKHIGRQVIAASALILMMTLLAFVQVGSLPMGEIGHFIHDAALFVVPLSAGGVATGIGLTRTWRWARMSMLVFGGLLTLFCAAPAIGFLFMPGGGIDSWQAVGLRAVGLLLLIPPILIVRWHTYFMRDDVKDCFRVPRKAPTPSV